MKNHFFFGYFGNKRNEFKEILPHIKKLLDGDEISHIIEPFCGSCAISFAISQLYPKKFKYILNDADEKLISLMKTCQDKEKFILLNNEINELAKTVENNKEEYIKVIKLDSLASYYIKQKIYNIRPGLFLLDYKYKYIDLSNCPMYDFLNNEDVTFLNKDGLDVFRKYNNNSKCLLFLDPPYLLSDNGYYHFKEQQQNIYEYLCNNDIKNNNAYILFILNIHWITRLLFKQYEIIEYSKKYEASKNKVIHGIIFNKNIK